MIQATHRAYHTRHAQLVGFVLIALAIAAALHFQDRLAADAAYNARVAACEHVQAVRSAALSVVVQAARQAHNPAEVAHYAMLARRYTPVDCTVAAGRP